MTVQYNPNYPLVDKIVFYKSLILQTGSDKVKYQSALEEHINLYPKSEFLSLAEMLLEKSKKGEEVPEFDSIILPKNRNKK